MRPHLRSRLLETCAGRFISGVLIYSPFAFGSTPQWAINQIVSALSIGLVIYFLHCILNRKRPAASLQLILLGVTGICCGWFMVYNARSVYVPGMYGMKLLHPPFPKLPGAVEQYTSRLAMQRIDAMFGALIIVVDLARSSRWRMEWMTVIASTGAAIAALGIAQNAGMVTFIGSRMSQMEGLYFSTFNYHGNAGAYLNLALPASFALCIYTSSDNRSLLRRLGAGLLVAVTVVGQLVNSSRGAQAIMMALLLALGILTAMHFMPSGESKMKRRRVLTPVLAFGAMGVLAIGIVLSKHNLEKWRELPLHVARSSSRWQVWRVAAPMARSAGVLGHGPGSFKMLLPVSPDLSNALYSRWVIQRHTPGSSVSMWSMAHNDYLQLVIEHGWLGFGIVGLILFQTLFFGASRCGFWSERRNSSNYAFLLGSLIALGGVLIHACFDFPLQVASIQITVVVLLGICISARRWNEPTPVLGI